MNLFKCKFCGKVQGVNALSAKSNLCRSCFMRLEELYDKSGIHNYIRDYGLSEDFKPEELAKELKIEPKLVRTLFDMGFFERDLQVYNHRAKERRGKLAEEFSQELDKIKKQTRPAERNAVVPPPPRKTVSYGGRRYQRSGW